MAVVRILLPQVQVPLLDYLLPDDLEVSAGDLVLVPFRRSEIVGIIWDTNADTTLDPIKLRLVRGKLNLKLDAYILTFIRAVAEHCICNIADIAKLVLPIELKSTFKVPKFDNYASISHELPLLSSDQQNCLVKASAADEPVLIYGVTGSGKTEVYFHLIAEMLSLKRQVLILLPEITLTIQLVHRFNKAFGFMPGIWHSRIAKTKKLKMLGRILSGEERVIIGARSSLFLPYHDLGLIIIDEEHAESYKQDSQVLYHARDVALIRGSITGTKILMCSATPSLEAFYLVQNKSCKLLKLPQRYHDVGSPDIQLIDMLRVKKVDKHWLSAPLVENIKKALHRKQQVLLFLNRRGYAPLVLCGNCAHRIMCPYCSAWLIAHKLSRKLACRYCGYNIPLSDSCSQCGAVGSMISCGPGVERIAETINSVIPEARSIIISSDNATTPKQLAAAIEQITNREVDIIIGTQMITKGHHFPHIGLVGIIDADVGLAGGDLRATERNFQILQQVAGRTNREQPGAVLIQTRYSQNTIFVALQKGDFDQFVASELKIRKDSSLPPFTKMVSVLLQARKEVELLDTAKCLAQIAPSNSSLRLLGPSPTSINKLNNYYRVRLLLIGDRSFNFAAYFTNWFSSFKFPSWISYRIDVDPYNFN